MTDTGVFTGVGRDRVLTARYPYDNNGNRSTRVAGATTYPSTLTSSTNLLAGVTDGTNTQRQRHRGKRLAAKPAAGADRFLEIFSTFTRIR